MRLQAHGKINLSLDITGRRENGYHDISSVMQSVELCDEVEIVKNASGSITVETDSADLPGGETNIAYKACAKIMESYPTGCGFDIFIRKRIPLAGGMAGGSTDAAAVLRGVNQLCDLGLSEETLMEIGVKIGADVPFCVQERPALATGIGEILEPVTGLPEDICIVLVNPGVQISTKLIYQSIDEKATYGTVENDKLVSALSEKNILSATNYMKNIMEPVTGAYCSQVQEIIDTLKNHGAMHAMMSGSGATCFGLFDTTQNKAKIEEMFPDYAVFVTKPFTGMDFAKKY